ncbi:MAG: HNH endonuclease [Anaerolineae bacterium]|nr:HNH endonuclease [Anaerolineae bacterium]
MTRIPLPLRQQVRERANNRCEYCRTPDQYSSNAFQIDHIIPIKRHGGSEGPHNMAWACPHCNRTKETDVGGYDEAGVLTPLFNPRTQLWGDHFYMDEAAIINGTSSIGQVTVRLLDLNSPLSVYVRLTLVGLKLW